MRICGKNIMEQAGLSCINLCYSHRGVPVIHDLSFTLNKSNILLIKGSNGSGKTTLLRLVASILKPETGEILLDGNPIKTVADYTAKALYIGHRTALKPSMTPRETVQFWSGVYGTQELEAAAIHYFGLERYADVACEYLSAGWRQKVALTRMILSPAKLWILDEPASHLDIEGSSLLQSLIVTRKEQGGMILMSMHGQVEAEGVQQIDLDIMNYNQNDKGVC